MLNSRSQCIDTLIPHTPFPQAASTGMRHIGTNDTPDRKPQGSGGERLNVHHVYP